ncbi:pyridoxamine 5'-phosphate oxidase family protein [Flagellimonas pacifica]|nr:pyridoxamine 5'-phosphate oxidase family protein [Allomuricauda parva]
MRKENINLLCSNYIGHLAFIFQGCPYVVPITYYYEQSLDCIIGYSAEGYKINAMRSNPEVTLEVDEIKAADKWKSVLVHGIYEEIHGSEAKLLLHQFALGVKNIIARKEQKIPQFISEYSSKLDDRGIPLVYKINIVEIIGRKRTS